MKKVGKQKALFIAKKVKASLVFNMAKLEGNSYTFPRDDAPDGYLGS